jgi:hypothetical protein
MPTPNLCTHDLIWMEKEVLEAMFNAIVSELIQKRLDPVPLPNGCMIVKDLAKGTYLSCSVRHPGTGQNWKVKLHQLSAALHAAQPGEETDFTTLRTLTYTTAAIDATSPVASLWAT